MNLELAQLPEAVRLKAYRQGADGRQWLASLSNTLDELSELWAVEPIDLLNGGSESLIVSVKRGDGMPAVVKIGLPGACDCAHEARLLQHAGGLGYVTLYCSDAGRNALLLERLGAPLADSSMPITARIETLCRTLNDAWSDVPAVPGLTTGAEKARSLSTFIESTWRETGHPCRAATKNLAREFALERAAAHNPHTSVLIHGDAHDHNTLRVPGTDRYKFVDPDGMLAEPALDLSVPMRGWNDDLVAHGITSRAVERCTRLAALTGAPERAIWQWGFMERVSTGLLLVHIGLTAEGTQTLAIADALAEAPLAWNRL